MSERGAGCERGPRFSVFLEPSSLRRASATTLPLVTSVISKMLTMPSEASASSTHPLRIYTAYSNDLHDVAPELCTMYAGSFVENVTPGHVRRG